MAHRRVGAPIAFAVVTILAVPVAYMAMFSGYQAYDDEGFFLMTLKDYLAGNPPVTPYVPLYGPFFYELFGGLFKLLGLAPTHDVGRFVTLTVWLLTAVVGGLTTWKLTKNLWLGVGGELATFVVLIALAREPMSTYGLSSLLSLGLIATAAYRPRRPRGSIALIGAIVAALLLTKVNVGGFAAAAAVFAWAASLAGGTRRVVLGMGVAAIVLLPFAITAAHLGGSVLLFAILVALSAAGVGAAGLVAGPRVEPPVSGAWLGAGAAAVLVVGAVVAMVQGSRPADLWNVLVVFALRFPGVFTWPLQINALADLWAVVGFIGAALVTRKGVEVGGYVRVGVGLFTWIGVLALPSSIFLLALPLAWMAALAPKGLVGDRIDPYARQLLAAFAVLEALQAYPVAGTQLSMAALALVPLGGVLIADGVGQLRLARVPGGAAPRVASWAPAATVLVSVAALELGGFLAWRDFTGDVPLGLPGAQSMRVPAQQRADLRALVSAIHDNRCSTLITFPGTSSFYLWAAPPATPMRYGQWWLTVGGTEQRSMVGRLEGEGGLCVVKNQRLIDLWTQGRATPSGPIVDFIAAGFVSAGKYGDYELLVRTSP